MQHNRVAYMFSIPEVTEPSPSNLLDILSSTSSPPSLSKRFSLAHKLSRCISQLHLVKWVHESFRSENVLFFPATASGGMSTSSERELDISEPWLLGFEFSRPEQYFSLGHADECLSRDIYRHPERQRSPTQTFNKIHDIYALGVVLLEIGLWQSVSSLDKSGFSKVRDPREIQKYLIKHAERRLGWKMGEKYQRLVIRCLKGDFGVVDDTKEDLKLQQAFRGYVVDLLQKSADSI
ncbi:hypothetical protein CLIM01_10584 [Colletotrichum limetticola]|uniref:Protein kinase domain-containing protein n=1 Tax=Colletotrichum limetticola TaxID=1209924 RepID=A0ABQ9PLP8_9PEZI|nr:hypothetical protein CLIM01_10584 [Colletotrichum limetticola]